MSPALGVLVAVLVGVAGIGVAGLLTVATFTSIPDLIRHPLSTLPTEPIDLDPPLPRRPARRRVLAAHTDLRAALRAAADA